MNWINFTTINQLVDIDVDSHQNPVVIFKHSTRCSISSAALARLEKNWTQSQALSEVKTYYLDLLSYRTISNAIATHYDVEHQSPQVLVIKNGTCIYNQSHMGITVDEIAECLDKKSA